MLRNHYKNSSKAIFFRNLRFSGPKLPKTSFYRWKWPLIGLSRIWIFGLKLPFGQRFRGLWRPKKMDFGQILRNHYKTNSKVIFSWNLRFWGAKKQKTSIWRCKWPLIDLKKILGPIEIFGFWGKKIFFSKKKNFFFAKIQKFWWGQKDDSPIGGHLHVQINIFCFFGAQKRKFQEKIALELVL